jgi:hypothetical protein
MQTESGAEQGQIHQRRPQAGALAATLGLAVLFLLLSTRRCR